MKTGPSHRRALSAFRLYCESIVAGELPLFDKVVTASDLVSVERGAPLIGPAFESRVLYPQRGLIKIVHPKVPRRTLLLVQEAEIWISLADSMPQGLTRAVDREQMSYLWAALPWLTTLRPVALEPVSVLTIEFKVLETLAMSYPSWANLLINGFASGVLRAQTELVMRNLGTARVRLDMVTEARPELVERLTNKELACYLGITNEALSRLLREGRDAEREARASD